MTMTKSKDQVTVPTEPSAKDDPEWEIFVTLLANQDVWFDPDLSGARDAQARFFEIVAYVQNQLARSRGSQKVETRWVNQTWSLRLTSGLKLPGQVS